MRFSQLAAGLLAAGAATAQLTQRDANDADAATNGHTIVPSNFIVEVTSVSHLCFASSRCDLMDLQIVTSD